MISQTKLMGGCRRRVVTGSSTTTLSIRDAKVQVFRSTGAGNTVAVPSGSVFVPREQPGLRYIIINEVASATSLTLQVYTDGDPGLFALAPGEVAWVYMTVAGLSWRVVVRALNTVRTTTSAPRGAVTNAKTPDTFTPACFDGDPCDGRTLESAGVAIPMFQNPCDGNNLAREPIRAGDCHMPRFLPLGFPETLAMDPLHPNGASALSDSFFAALYNGGSVHFLEYAGPAHGTSRHWHHIRRVGNIGSLPGAWRLATSGAGNGVTVKRHVWKKIINYKVDEQTFHAELRIVAEYCWSGLEPVLVETPDLSLTSGSLSQIASDKSLNLPLFYLLPDFNQLGFKAGQIIEIGADGNTFTGGGYNGYARIVSISSNGRKMICNGAWTNALAFVDDAAGETVKIKTLIAGGTQDADEGTYGAIVNMYVLTDEKYPTFVDGDSYTPTGAPSTVTFTKNDPCVWGGLTPWSSLAHKYCHPQMVLCGNVPTTFQAPCGSDWIPLGDEDRAYCYQRPNGAPWTTAPGCCGSVSDGSGIWPNVVFGDTVADFTWGAITVGGDFPESKPLEYITLENGPGVGRTLCKPTHAGWDEAVGQLDVENGSDVTFSFCDVGQRQFSACLGNLDEPFEGVGGSHKCFKNHAGGQRADDPTMKFCCVNVGEGSTAIGMTNQQCTRSTTVYGAFNGVNCDEISSNCSNTRLINTVFNDMELYDYSFSMNGDQTLRIATWKQLVHNPDQILYSYTYDSAVTGDLVQEVGTVTYTATQIRMTARNNAKPVKNVLLYNPASSVHEDATVSTTFVFRNGANLASHGLAQRASVDGSDNTTAYLAVIDLGNDPPSVTLYKDTGGTLSTIASRLFEGVVVEYDGANEARVTGSFSVDGSTLVFTFDGGTQNSWLVGELSGDNCDLTSGHPGVVTLTDKEARFEDFVVTDQTESYVEVTANLLYDEVQFSAPLQATHGYGQCEEVHDPRCGLDYCNCTTWADARHEILGTFATEPAVFGPPDCYGPVCETTSQPLCGPCPQPFLAAKLILPGSCADAGAPSMSICGGLEIWSWSILACL